MSKVRGDTERCGSILVCLAACPASASREMKTLQSVQSRPTNRIKIIQTKNGRDNIL